MNKCVRNGLLAGAGAAMSLSACSSSHEAAPQPTSTTTEVAVPAPTPTTELPVATTTTTKEVCAQKVEVTSPANWSSTTYNQGINMIIKTCGLAPGETVWVLDQTVGDNGLIVVDGEGPAAVRNGITTFPDQPIGEEHADSQVQVTTVVANPDCADFLAAALRANGMISGIPADACAIVDQRTIVALQDN